MNTQDPVAKAMQAQIEETARCLRSDLKVTRHTSMTHASGYALLTGQNDLALEVCKAEARMSDIIDEMGDQLAELGAPSDVPEDSNATLHGFRFHWLTRNCEALRTRHPLIREFHQLWQSRLMV